MVLRRALAALVLAVVLAPTTAAQGPNPPAAASASLSSTNCPGTGCVALKVNGGFGGFAVQVTGTWVGTLTVEGSVDNATFQAVNVAPTNSTTAVSTVTTNGVWAGSVAGLVNIRARFSAYTSGTAVVSIVASVPSGSSGGGGGGGGGDASAANQVIGNASLASLDSKTPALGQATMANSSPVVIASNQSAVPVTGPLTDTQIRATPLPVSGAVTTTPPANATTNITQFGGTNVSTGTGTGGAGIPRVTVSSDSFPATQAVSATSLPLPTGASTAANQATGNASIASIDAKTPALVSGRQPVDGSGVTQPTSFATATSSVTVSAASASCLGTNCASVSTVGMGGVFVDIDASGVASLEFEAADVAVFGSQSCYLLSAGLPGGGPVFNVLSGGGTLAFLCPITGQATFRVRASAYTSGSPTVTLRTVPFSTVQSITQGTANGGSTDSWYMRLTSGGADSATVTGATVLATSSDPALVTRTVQLPAFLGANGGLQIEGVANGTVVPVSAASLPLPALAATSTIQTNRTQKTQLTDGTRDGTVKAASTAPLLTDTAVVTTQRDPLPAGTNVIGHAITDSGSTTAVTGNVAVTNAGLTNLDVALSTRTKPADQQHTIIDSGSTVVTQGTGSNLHMVCDSGCSSSAGFADNSAFTYGTTAVNPIAGVLDDVSTNVATENSAAIARITPQKGLHINLRNQAGTEIGTASTPVQVSLANTGANTNKILVTADPISYATPAAVSATWDSSTVVGTTLSISTVGYASVMISVVPSTTVGGTSSLNVADDNGNPAFTVYCAVTSTGALFTTPALSQAFTYTCNVAGFASFNVKMTGAITSGTTNVRISASMAPIQPFVMATLTSSNYNLSQVGGVAVAVNTGVANSATQRVVLASGSGVSAAQSGTWSDRITDGTNTATVKAASTLPAATDTALVVTERDTVTVSGTVTTTPPANASTNIAQVDGTNTVTGGVAGLLAVGGNVANAVTATANPIPVGGVFTTTPATLTTGQTATLQFTAAQNAKQDLATIAGTAPTTAGKIDVKGADGDVFVRQTTGSNLHVQLDAGAATIGALTANQSVNHAQIAGVTVSTGNGVPDTGTQRVFSAQRRTYSASTTAKTATAAGTAPFFALCGSASQTVRVQKVLLSGTVATAAIYGDVVLKKTSTATSSGTATTLTAAPHDSNSAAATATVKYYTVLATAGTSVGVVQAQSAVFPLTGTVAASMTQLSFLDMNRDPVEAIVLRGTAQCLEMSFGTTPTNAPTLAVSATWTEE